MMLFGMILQQIERRLSTLRLAANGEEPVLTLPEGCAFSAFCTHTWGTGQASAVNRTRDLQHCQPPCARLAAPPPLG